MRSPTPSSTCGRVAACAVVLLLIVGPRWWRAEAAGSSARAGGKTYAPFPEPGAGYVTDIADVLTPAQEERIEVWLWQVEHKTKVEIIVVTLNSMSDYPGTPSGSVGEFARALFDKYGIGNMPKNDGVLLLVAVKDRKARIELGGYYGHARDAEASGIMAHVIVPRFKKGDYAGGVTAGVKALCKEFAEARIGLRWGLIAVLVAIPVAAMTAISLFVKGKTGWGWVFVGLVIVLVIAAVILVKRILQSLPESSSDSWAAGGAGGFGGGSSGGGGASGSW